MAEAVSEPVPVPTAEIHYSANALALALSEGARKYTGIDERPIERLLCWALNTNHWLGTELLAFPEGLDYRTQETGELADVSGFSPDIAWSKGAAPLPRWNSNATLS